MGIQFRVGQFQTHTQDFEYEVSNGQRHLAVALNNIAVQGLDCQQGQR